MRTALADGTKGKMLQETLQESIPSLNNLPHIKPRALRAYSFADLPASSSCCDAVDKRTDCVS